MAKGSSTFSSGVAQFAAQVLGLALAVVISGLIAYRLGVSETADALVFGRRLVTGLTEALAQTVGIVLIPVLAAQFGRGHRTAGAILGRGTLICLAIGAAGSVLVAALADQIAGALTPGATNLADKAAVLLRFAPVLPLALVMTFVISALNLSGRFGIPALARLLPRVGMALCLLVLAGELLVWVPWSYVVGMVLACAVVGAMALGLARGPSDLAPAPSEAPQGQLVLAMILGICISQVVLWAETYFAAATGTGGLTVLELTQRIAGLVGNTLALALITPVFALWSRNRSARTPARFARFAWTGLAAIGILQAFLLINRGPVIGLLLDHGTLDRESLDRIANLYVIFAAAPLSVFLGRLAMIWLLSANDRRLFLKIVFIVLADLGVRVAIMSALTPTLGLMAVGLSMIVAPLVVLLAVVMLSWREFSRQMLSPDRAMPVILAVVAAVAAAGLTSLGVTAVQGADPGKLAAVLHLTATGGVMGVTMLAALKLQGLSLSRRGLMGE